MHARPDRFEPRRLEPGRGWTPHRETDRLAVLHSLGLLDSAPAGHFDWVTRHLARVCRVPLALITLVDADRQWFLSTHGSELVETPRSWSFCQHAMGGAEPLVVRDATLDERFRENPMVTGDGLRFYAGMGIWARQHPLGALCVADTRPRQLGEEQREALVRMAEHVGLLIELRALRAASA